MIRRFALLLMLAAPTAPAAGVEGVPRVVADIAPVASLAARVMQGVGTPDLLLPPGVSPHDHALLPSDGARLAAADLVIWVGPGLTPWLEAPLGSLAEDATFLVLGETGGWDPLPMREDPLFATDHDQAEHAGHDDHAAGGSDPHAWLDPGIAAVWMASIAKALAAADPDNAAAYRANAVAGAAEMAALATELEATLAPARGRAYLLPHDGYQYFEARFDLPASGAISLTDASTPGAARIATLRDMVADGAIACVLTDLETGPDWATLLRDGTLARTAEIDSIGIGLDPGPALYPQMMRRLAGQLRDCLG